MQALTRRFRQPPSRYMMLLSFASVLGGMTTLIGSSTNLLVSLELASLGERPFGFFDFTIPGLVLAGSGLCYLLLVAPRLLPVRGPLPRSEEHTSELQSLMSISYAGFCLEKQ